MRTEIRQWIFYFKLHHNESFNSEIKVSINNNLGQLLRLCIYIYFYFYTLLKLSSFYISFAFSNISKRIKDQIVMEKQHGISQRQELIKLYHKKINYGHKVQELYQPEVQSEARIQSQQDKIKEMRSRIRAQIGRSPSIHDYIDHRLESNPVKSSLSVNKPNFHSTSNQPGGARLSLEKIRMSKDNLTKFDTEVMEIGRNQSLKDNKTTNNPPQKKSQYRQRDTELKLTLRQSKSPLTQAQLLKLQQETQQQLSSARTASIGSTPLNRGRVAQQIVAANRAFQTVDANNVQNDRAGNRQSGAPFDIQKAISHEVEADLKQMRSLKSKIAILSQADAL